MAEVNHCVMSVIFGVDLIDARVSSSTASLIDKVTAKANVD